MRALVLVMTACWTGTPPTPPPEKQPSGVCRIHEVDVQPQAPVKLRVRGKTFASLGSQLQRLDVTVTESRARAVLETELVEIEGDLALDEQPVRPSVVELRDGWLEITKAFGRKAVGTSLRFDVELEEELAPRTPSFEIPCSHLTFSEPPEEPDLPADAAVVEVRQGTTAKLHATFGGPPIATVTGRAKPTGDAPHEPFEAHVLERRGKMVRVRFARPNAVVAWIDASAVREIGGQLYGGLMGNMIGSSGSRVRCAKPVPLFVRLGREEIRVGRLKADVYFQPHHVDGVTVIDLGTTDVKVFLKPGLAACLKGF